MDFPCLNGGRRDRLLALAFWFCFKGNVKFGLDSMAEAEGPAARPLSPHLQIYRLTLTMLMSIVHRITGVALYFGTLLLAWWLIAAASGPNASALFHSVPSGFIGQIARLGY